MKAETAQMLESAKTTILNELKNCSFNMYKGKDGKPHIVLGYSSAELGNYEKDICIDYTKIVGYLREKFASKKQNPEQIQEQPAIEINTNPEREI